MNYTALQLYSVLLLLIPDLRQGFLNLNTYDKNELKRFGNCLTLDKHRQENMHSGATFSTTAFSTQAAFLTVPRFSVARVCLVKRIGFGFDRTQRARLV